MRRTAGQIVLAVGFILTAASAVSSQVPGTGRLMRAKLTHAQRILEALTASNYMMLDRETSALAAIAESPAWTTVLGIPEFRSHGGDFQRIVRDLRSAAMARNLDEAVEQYASLTKTCYQCHRYVKNRRIVGSGPGGR